MLKSHFGVFFKYINFNEEFYFGELIYKKIDKETAINQNSGRRKFNPYEIVKRRFSK